MKKLTGTIILAGVLALWTNGNCFAQAGGGGAGGGAGGGSAGVGGTSGQTGTGASAGVQPAPGNGLNNPAGVQQPAMSPSQQQPAFGTGGTNGLRFGATNLFSSTNALGFGSTNGLGFGTTNGLGFGTTNGLG